MNDLARRRAAAQGLAGQRDRSPAALVRRFGAVQAQDYPYAKWAVAQRLAHDVDEVEAAVAAGDILRTHVLRPTWHFVPRDDLRWMQQLTGPRVLAQLGSFNRLAGVDEALSRRGTRALAAALATHGHLTRREIGDALARAGIKTTNWVVGALLMHAELLVIVCSGVPRGRQQTYALVDERSPRPVRLAGDEALATLARRYFQSHGPATVRDFRWWSGLDAARASRAVATLGRSAERIAVDGRDYFTLDTPARARTVSAQLVHTFDEILVGYTESRGLIDVRGVSGPNGATQLRRSVLLDGQLAGRWGVPPDGAIELLRRLTPRERRAVDLAHDRLRRAFAGPARRRSHARS